MGAGLETVCLFFQRLTPIRPGGLKEQTAVFQLTGQTFGKVVIEPIHWVTLTVLKIARHDYYTTTNESGFSRDYDITSTIGDEDRDRT